MAEAQVSIISWAFPEVFVLQQEIYEMPEMKLEFLLKKFNSARVCVFAFGHDIESAHWRGRRETS